MKAKIVKSDKKNTDLIRLNIENDTVWFRIFPLRAWSPSALSNTDQQTADTAPNQVEWDVGHSRLFFTWM
jgi:hypothetical protein